MAHVVRVKGSTLETWVRNLAVIGCAASAFWLTSACQTSCGINNAQEPILYVDGKTHDEGPFRTYESTLYDGEWLYFPGGRRFSLEHHLGTSNYSTLHMEVAFSSRPTSGDAGGDVAIASGDVAIIEKFDDKTIQLRNDTCSEQYLYVKIAAPIPVPETDAGATD